MNTVKKIKMVEPMENVKDLLNYLNCIIVVTNNHMMLNTNMISINELSHKRVLNILKESLIDTSNKTQQNINDILNLSKKGLYTINDDELEKLDELIFNSFSFEKSLSAL